MGFKIVSDVLLTKEQLLKAVREAEVDLMTDPELVNMRPANYLEVDENDQGNQYYVRLVEENPFEYLVFTVDEVMNILRVKMHYDGTRAALCNILRHAKVPFADDEEDSDDDEEDEDDVADDNNHDNDDENDNDDVDVD